MIKNNIPYLILGANPTEFRILPDIKGNLFLCFPTIALKTSQRTFKTPALTDAQVSGLKQWGAQVNAVEPLVDLQIRDRYVMCVTSGKHLSLTSVGKGLAKQILPHLEQTQTFWIQRQDGVPPQYDVALRNPLATTLVPTFSLEDQITYMEDNTLQAMLKEHVGDKVWSSVPYNYSTPKREISVVTLDF